MTRARLLAAAVAVPLLLLAGCTPVFGPAVTPTASETAANSSTAVPTESPTPTPTAEPLPAGAFLRATVTANNTAGESMTVVLLVADPTNLTDAVGDVTFVRTACPTAIASRSQSYAVQPVALDTAVATATGIWSSGAVNLRIAGILATVGKGSNVAPSDDSSDGYGCGFAALTGIGTAKVYGLLGGASSTADAADIQTELEHGVFGIEENSGDGSVTFGACRMDLSPRAQAMLTSGVWQSPQEWGHGCLIGYGGSA